MNNTDEQSDNSSILLAIHISHQIKNPMITKFNSSSFFIYNINEYQKYLGKIKDLNRIKLSNKEFLFLKEYSDKIILKEQINHHNTFITIKKSLANDLFNLFKKPIERNPLEILDNRTNFTCRKLAKKKNHK